MNRITLITDLQESQEKLSVMYADLNELLSQLSAVIDDKEFIPEHLKESFCDKLSLISDAQTEFVQQYCTLGIGDPSSSIDKDLCLQKILLKELEEFTP